jgi:cellulose synthase/poly-beta-1,6-N-acetylglucosamine synthase-like glycosyltransferase
VVGIVPGAGGAFRTSALREVGGYPRDTLVEDADLTVTLLRAGWRVTYEPKAVTWTEAPERLSEVVKQRRRWSFGTVEVVAKHRGALLDPAAGRVGLVLLPWQLLTQVLLPLLGPLADLFLAYLLVVHAHHEAASVLLLAIVGDAVAATVAVILDGESPRLVLLAPLLRLLWRPLQLLVLASAARRWATGGGERWRKLRRTGTVAIPGAA